jgi:hypothetical protein
LDDASSSSVDLFFPLLSLPLAVDNDVYLFSTQIKRQGENRLREHFTEPLRAQAHATVDEDDDAREPERRIPQPF